MAWDKVCKHKRPGGLNVTSLIKWNRATYTKLMWNLHNKGDKFWVIWVHIYYMEMNDVMTCRIQGNCSWILKCRITVERSVYWNSVLATDNFSTALMYMEFKGNKIYQNVARPKALFMLWLRL